MNEYCKKQIVEHATSLEEYGLNDLAWKKDEAISLIKSLMAEKIGILGGDIFKIDSHRLIPLYDNWSCQPNKNESEDQFNLKSKLESLKYIEKYPVSVGEKIVFAITFTERFN